MPTHDQQQCHAQCKHYLDCDLTPGHRDDVDVYSGGEVFDPTLMGMKIRLPYELLRNETIPKE